jgi:hypothetical protein
MNCPWDHQPQQNHTAGSLCTSNLSALTEMHGHVNHLWLLGSVSETDSHTVLCFMGCERNGVQYSQSATLPSALWCQARCGFFLKGVGPGDLLGRRLDNHSLPTSLRSNTELRASFALHTLGEFQQCTVVWALVIFLSTQSEKVQGTFTPAWNVHLLSNLGWQEVCPASWHMPQLNMQPKRLQRENSSGVLSIFLTCSVRKVTCSLQPAVAHLVTSETN